MVIRFKNLCSRKDKKKTWTTYFVYVLPGIAKHHRIHLRVKAHADGVSILTFTLVCSNQIWRIRESKIQADASIFFMSFCSFVYVIGILCLIN
jgi:hypothetical protein